MTSPPDFNNIKLGTLPFEFLLRHVNLPSSIPDDVPSSQVFIQSYHLLCPSSSSIGSPFLLHSLVLFVFLASMGIRNLSSVHPEMHWRSHPQQ